MGGCSAIHTRFRPCTKTGSQYMHKHVVPQGCLEDSGPWSLLRLVFVFCRLHFGHKYELMTGCHNTWWGTMCLSGRQTKAMIKSPSDFSRDRQLDIGSTQQAQLLYCNTNDINVLDQKHTETNKYRWRSPQQRTTNREFAWKNEPVGNVGQIGLVP